MIMSTKEAGEVGRTVINDMTIVPGDNSLPLTGTVNQTGILASLNTTTGFVTLQITGESAIYNGQHLTYYVRPVYDRYPYLNTLTNKQEEPLKNNVLHLDMNVVQVLADSAAAAAANTTKSA